nr:beta galactosidase [Penicillium canescens]
MKLLSSWVVAALAAQAAGAAISHKLDGFTIREHADPAKRALLQKYVTTDEHSIFVNGERLMIFS